MTYKITDNFDLLLKVLPSELLSAFTKLKLNPDEILEIVLDFGRQPEIRLANDQETTLLKREITLHDLNYVVQHIGGFTEDNRAGVERTLHRISAIRNRKGTIIGLTCRVGRAVYGVIDIVKDVIESGKSILFLGAPGVGKTTMLREAARILSSEMKKRVIIIDTSNEIAGDGDIPHEAIGRARRMQVPAPSQQHRVMIEAVENHMPQSIIIDEISISEETTAARTIAERGVQLIGTAHGRSLENLILNPTLVDLIGGIQTVTLSDEEAYRRNTQKSVLERMRPPTFDIVVEILNWDHMRMYEDSATAVDTYLSGEQPAAQIRKRSVDGKIETTLEKATKSSSSKPKKTPLRQFHEKYEQFSERNTLYSESLEYEPSHTNLKIYLFGVSRKLIEQAAKNLDLPLKVTQTADDAQAIFTLKSLYKKRPKKIRKIEAEGVPIYILKEDTLSEIADTLANILNA
ncbi:MAG: AAA family ATPase [bacterium]